MLDAAINVVPAWLRCMTVRAGKLTLIKSVLMARPVHQLLVADAPIFRFEEIGKSLRAFFWPGKKVQGGQCLLSWNNKSKTHCFDGLGVENLRLQGLALRVRWEWPRRRKDLGRASRCLRTLEHEV
jgi:hypothetical protein